MKIFSAFFLALILFASAQGQTIPVNNPAVSANNPAAPAAAYQYFLSIAGITSKQQVEAVENKIGALPGVLFFLSKEFPPKYFVLKTSRAVTTSDVTAWLEGTGLTVQEMLPNIPENEDRITEFLRLHPHVSKRRK